VRSGVSGSRAQTLSRRGLFRGALAAGMVSTAAVAERAHARSPRWFTTTIDLTHTMSPDFPTFFGVPGIEMEKFDFKQGRIQSLLVSHH
jgi:hypothetical protein